MIRRSTWILVLIFAIVVGLAWLFQRYQGGKAESTATVIPTASLKSLYDFDNKQLDQVDILDSSGNKIGLYRDTTSNQWAVVDVPADKADAFQIESITAQLTGMKITETLDQTPPLDAIGLASPAYTITMTTSEGVQLVTYVGSPIPTGNGYYLRVGSDPVVIVDKVAMDSILNIITNPPLIPTPTPEVMPTGTSSPTDENVQETPAP
jgi:Domain of unknown function (DUF4340)